MSTLQAVEVGRLEINLPMLLRISARTGVDMVWLANGDPTAAPLAVKEFGGVPYTSEIFKAACERDTDPQYIRTIFAATYTKFCDELGLILRKPTVRVSDMLSLSAELSLTLHGLSPAPTGPLEPSDVIALMKRLRENLATCVSIITAGGASIPASTPKKPRRPSAAPAPGKTPRKSARSRSGPEAP